MTNDQLLTIILSIGIPMLAGFGWIIIKLFSFQSDVQKEFKSMGQDIRTLDSRISHIEGYLMGRDFKTGTGEK